MILVDTSVWVDHLHRGVPAMASLLEDETVLMHPFVIGELACGDIRSRREVLHLLTTLPAAPVASDSEVLTMIERHKLMGRGLGYVDVHLLTSAVLCGCRIWSLDKHLAAVAAGLKVRFDG
ncbi:MAG: PIN domain-containing protein [Acidobacteriota bacterium]